MKTNQPIQSCIRPPLWRGLARLLFTVNCLLLTVFTACNSDDSTDIGNEPVAVQFASSVGNVAQQRTFTAAGGTQWTMGDQVGIFMLKESATLASTNIVGGADNKAYKAQSGSVKSGFTPVDGIPIYYPTTGKVDFIAYYPYTTPLTDYKLPVNVSNQSDPSKIDVLYSNNVKAKDKNSGTVSLQFSHALSKLSFTLKTGVGAPNLTGATIAISNVKTTADVILATGLVENLGPEGTITTHTDATAIVIPQTTGSCKLTVTLVDGVSKFECDFSNQKFVQGKNHPYTITVNRTGITVSAGNITGWDITDGEITGDTAIRYKVGDYYPDPDVVYASGAVTSGAAATGIVYWLKDPVDGKSKHGKIVSLDEGTNLRWNAWAGDAKAKDMDNGIVNMEGIKNNPNSKPYEAYNWVHAKNKDTENYSDATAKGIWYLPAKNELQHLYCAYNGALPITWFSGTTSAPTTDATARGLFNSKLTAAGGTGLSGNWYWSSSESDNRYAWFVVFDTGRTNFNDKAGFLSVRAVSAF